MQRGVLAEAGGSLADLYLNSDGPGYCLHVPLRRQSRPTAALLDRIQRVGRDAPERCITGTGTGAVHGDFHPGNVLVAAGSSYVVAGVVDWTAAQAGDCGLDLITLGSALDHDAAAAEVRAMIRERITAVVYRAALLGITARMALRQVDWAIRHHSPQETQHWVDIAADWFSWASLNS